jgi:hypothetical protein
VEGREPGDLARLHSLARIRSVSGSSGGGGGGPGSAMPKMDRRRLGFERDGEEMEESWRGEWE